MILFFTLKAQMRKPVPVLIPKHHPHAIITLKEQPHWQNTFVITIPFPTIYGIYIFARSYPWFTPNERRCQKLSK